MDKKNLTQYSDDELSLIVFNDEYLYSIRNSSHLISTLDELYIYTPQQRSMLYDDLYYDELQCEIFDQ